MTVDTDRLRRWRLVLGGDGAGPGSGLEDAQLSEEDSGVDRALAALYDKPDEEAAGGPRSANLGASAPRVARWLGDVRRYFPSTVVQVMQRDAVDRLGLTRMLLEKELLSAVEPDVHLVGTLLSLNSVLPEETKETAREVVRKVVEELEERLADRTRAAIKGALDKASRTHRPRPGDVDWARTIHANLKHYSPELRTIVPEKLIGFGRRQQAVQRDVILAVDQSGSMAESVVYSGLFGAVLASMRALKTSFVAFDTEVADLTEHLADPVDVLFGTQLGGGTDINRAIAYCQGLVARPEQTLLVLISDRAPSYDHENAAALAELGVPAFACTPDQFPELMAAAVRGDDLQAWAARESS